jgi:hypothetical protein
MPDTPENAKNRGGGKKRKEQTQILQGGEASGALRVESVNPRFGGLQGEQVAILIF